MTTLRKCEVCGQPLVENPGGDVTTEEQLAEFSLIWDGAPIDPVLVGIRIDGVYFSADQLTSAAGVSEEHQR